MLFCSKTYNTLHSCHNFPAGPREAARVARICETSPLLQSLIQQGDDTLSTCVGYPQNKLESAWWRHQMETLSALQAICAGNSPVSGEFSAQRPVARSFDIFFDLRLNKWLCKQSWGWWFETLSCPLWRHRNGKQATQWTPWGQPLGPLVSPRWSRATSLHQQGRTQICRSDSVGNDSMQCNTAPSYYQPLKRSLRRWSLSRLAEGHCQLTRGRE